MGAVRISRAREWRRTAWALAALFASLPLACRVFTGEWGFDGSFEIAGLCLMLGAYLHLQARKSLQAPDSAELLDRAIRLALAGLADEAIVLLTEAIRLSPRLWQAFQYRAELRLREPATIAAAIEDLDEAIRLAPDEPDLYMLRGRAYNLLGDGEQADLDYQRAAAAGQSTN